MPESHVTTTNLTPEVIMVDWNSPTWGNNPVHMDTHGSFVPDAHTESGEDY